MEYLYYVLILVISSIVIYYFNKKLHIWDTHTLLTISLVESFILAGLLLLTSLEGFIYKMAISVIFLGVLFLGYIRFLKQNIESNDSDELLEPIKNSFIFINITVFPFFIALTILRYQNVFLQIILSLGIAVAVYYLSKPLQKGIANLIETLRYKIDLSGSKGFILLWSIIGITALTVAAFDFPDQPILNALNLNNHMPLYGGVSTGLDVDVQGNFEKEFIAEYSTKEALTNDYTGIRQNDHTINYDASNTYSLEINMDSSNTTTYILTNLNTNETISKSYGGWDYHNTVVFFTNDYIYLLNTESTVIEIMDYDLNIFAIHNIQPKEAFWYNNRYNDFDLYGMVLNDTFYYIQEDINDGISTYTVYKLVEQDVALHLPFYTHYSIYHIILVLIFMCIPISDFKTTITTIDFKSKYTKKAN